MKGGKPPFIVLRNWGIDMGKGKQKGSQAVEFALVLPFMILIIFTVLDFGILAYDKAIITNASREAVRRGVVLTATAWNANTIKQVACDYARSAVVTVSTGTRNATCTGTADPTVTVTPTAAPAFGDPITVNVSFPVKGFSLGTWWALGTGANAVGSSMTLTSSTKMLHE
jgi:Flp pilus assembly protein TadG